MSLFPVVLVLWDPRIHISFSNSGNISIYIEKPVDKTFSFYPILRVLNVDPHYYHVRLRRSFDKLRTRYQNSVIEDISPLDDTLDDI